MVNQRSIRMSMRVMIRVRSIRVPQFDIIINADTPKLYVTEKIMRISFWQCMVAPTGTEPQRRRAVRSSLEVARTVPVCGVQR